MNKKYHFNNLLKCYLVVVSIIFFASCGTVRVPINVTHPAEINMVSYKQIAITDVTGNLGQSFSDSLKNKLVDGGRFKVVDRNRMKQIMAELHISQTDLADPENSVKLGKLLTASVIITGRLNGKYKEKLTQEKATCGNKEDGYYSCINYERKGDYQTNGSIDVIDVATGQILKSKLLNAGYTKTTSQKKDYPPAIDKDQLAGASIEANVNVFLKAITPWDEVVYIPFEKDKAIPDLERGINQAKIGEMEEAVNIFKTAIASAKQNGDIKPKSLANAYFNLGLACTYIWDFDQAIEAFKKAYSLNPKDTYIQWKKKAEEQREERRKLEEQQARLREKYFG